MVMCIVAGCSRRSGRDIDVSFYRIPKVITGKGFKKEQLSKRRREGYIAAISRVGLTEKVISNDRVCSRHFVTGKPAALKDEQHPDWLPTQHLGKLKHVDTPNAESVERYERLKRRQELKDKNDTESDGNEGDRSETESDGNDEDESDVRSEMEITNQSTRSTEVQTDLTRNHILLFQQELIVANERISQLEGLLEGTTHLFTAEATLSDDKFVQFYTGLPNAAILNAVYEFVAPKESSLLSKLTPFQEMMLTLVKLRLNPSIQDLAYRFGVHCSTVSRIFLKWLIMLDTKLKPLLLWPEREDLRRTMPECFRASFKDRVAVIIDCFEVFIERPSNLLARAATWSAYKHHNTAKFLIGITPQGVVSYISDAWGGRVSDKYLTEHCGMLAKLLPGDVVLADRGFDIADSVGMYQARLHIPAFTKGKNQLTALEVEETRSIANVRIHVERVIGMVRQKYTILQGTLPIDYVTTRNGEDYPAVDHIVRIACALCNLCNSVVPFD